MIRRIDALDLYRLVLDREPESEQVVNEKRAAESVSGAAAEMLMSDEFVSRNRALIAACLARSG